MYGFGRNGNVVGNGLIKQSDLPNISSGFSFAYGNANDNNWPNGAHCNVLGNAAGQSASINNIFMNAPSPGGGEYQYQAGLRYQWNLNGGVSQTQFKPAYRERFEVIFIRDIFYNFD